IRKGPGTENDKVMIIVDGKEVPAQLGLNQRVQITEIKDEWYHIFAIVEDQKVEGYVKGTFITPDNGSGFRAISDNTQQNVPTPIINEAQYAAYDTVWREWWYENNSTHDIPKSSYSNNMTNKFKQYGAYYADLNATKEDKVIYLTFDCGYENGYTERILDTLKKYNIKACFFVTKGYLEQAPGIAKRMKDEGHIVGNHTVNHPSLPKLSSGKIASELVGVSDYFKKVTGYELDPFMRPPMGDFSETSLKVQQDLGYKTIFWSIAIYNDFNQDYQDKVDTLGPFKKWHHSGAIALIHAVSKTNTEKLEEVILFLKGEGYRFGTLDQLS
ncbi:MAG: polysaccharide deacetylase family protein, partial [Lachnospiraceae bacterium]|nr:polysaccharide deacetylase family protein [Lachnospiraceae bacterium]